MIKIYIFFLLLMIVGCGTQEDDDSTLKIIGGNEFAQEGKGVFKVIGSRAACTATLVKSHILLTAGHCITANFIAEKKVSA